MKRNVLMVLIFLFAVPAGLCSQNKLARQFKQSRAFKDKANHDRLHSPSSSTNSLPGCSVNYLWNNQTSQWVYSDSSFYVYTSSGDLKSEIRRNGTPNSRTLITYDAQGRIIQYLQQFWYGYIINWQDLSRHTYQFNNQGYMTQHLYESYSTTSNQWVKQWGQKNILTYDALNRITDNIYQGWDNIANTWENSYRETAFIFDANNNILSLESKLANGVNWDNDYKYSFVYGINNQPVEYTVQIWNGTIYENSDRWINLVYQNWCGWNCNDEAILTATIQNWGWPQTNQWNTTERINSVYDAFGGYVETLEFFIGTTWENYSRYTLSYDSNTMYTGSNMEFWDSSINAWLTNYQDKQIHTYDMSSNIAQTIFQYWDLTNMTLINHQKRVYNNFNYVGINENHIQTGSLSIFPNPCSGECSIEYGEGVLNRNADYQFKIFDAQGKLVHSEPMSGSSLKFSTNGIRPGIYFYHLLNGTGQIKTGKLIVN